jgi:poly(3-hydroxybutyrate) depolymerase
LFLVGIILLSIAFRLAAQSSVNNSGIYTSVIEGFDWGPAVSKVILTLADTTSVVKKKDYNVSVQRKTNVANINPERATGERTVVFAYVSDNKGNRIKTGKFITLVLMVGPDLPIGSPIEYLRQNNQARNQWIDYKLTITNTVSNQVWDKESGRIMPLIDQFDISGKFKYNDKLSLSYAAFTPKTNKSKFPLIIWLHGGGEGGTDPTIPLVGNRAANYASNEIQAIFGGAYVLVPQCPGAWMHNAEGVTTSGRENDIYNEGLMTLIKDFVAKHPNIDTKRIYVGGCSNGGYMSLKLILQHPNYFAAGFISALAYQSQYLTDTQISSIKHVPIWFIHSEDDATTLAKLTAIPVYERLIAAGAKDVHFSFYKRVTDITGFFGGENYYYNGHWSWIYSHANLCKLDYDGKPVTIKGRPVTIMEWMATKSKK